MARYVCSLDPVHHSRLFECLQNLIMINNPLHYPATQKAFGGGVSTTLVLRSVASQLHQERRISFRGKKKPRTKMSGSVDDLSQNPELRRHMRDPNELQKKSAIPQLEGSIFDSELQEQEAAQKATAARREQAGRQTKKGKGKGKMFKSMEMYRQQRDSAVWSSFATDPDPRARVRWQRKKVIHLVRSAGRMSRKMRIMQSERQVHVRSPFFRTSTKKLMHLARQIAGKTVREALVQMRFSKKKWAAKVLDHLQEARNLAIAKHGMGLGRASGEAPLKRPVKIFTKDGKELMITDPTSIYIDQAWVGRGKYNVTRLKSHGRGRINSLHTPQASKFSISPYHVFFFPRQPPLSPLFFSFIFFFFFCMLVCLAYF